MSIQLKDCPFCGGPAEHGNEYENDGWWDKLETTYYIVECYGCGAKTYRHNSPEEAAEWWNKRVGET